MAARNHRPDKKLERLLDALRDAYGPRHPKAKIEGYRYNPSCVRVRITDPDFKKVDFFQRDEEVEAIIATLPEEMQAAISFLVLVTPAEKTTSPSNIIYETRAPISLV